MGENTTTTEIIKEILQTRCLICHQQNVPHGVWCDKCWRGYCQPCYDTLQRRISEETAEMRKVCNFCTTVYDRKCTKCQSMHWEEPCECNPLCKCFEISVHKIKKQHNIEDFVLGEVYHGEVLLFCNTCCSKSFFLI